MTCIRREVGLGDTLPYVYNELIAKVQAAEPTPYQEVIIKWLDKHLEEVWGSLAVGDALNIAMIDVEGGPRKLKITKNTFDDRGRMAVECLCEGNFVNVNSAGKSMITDRLGNVLSR